MIVSRQESTFELVTAGAAIGTAGEVAAGTPAVVVTVGGCIL